ncbi:MAG: antibiotic biosynthesis monooxygenase family protein [Bacteroidota bacterium]
MIKRIVKMTFLPEEVDNFLADFETIKNKIRNRDGCQHLELWRAVAGSNIFFTYSYWDSEEALNAYRHSDLFKVVWQRTKAKFAEKAQAWSVEVVAEVE